MAEPVVEARRVRADLRYLRPDLYRPGLAMRVRPSAVSTEAGPAAVMERVERELADAAWRYRWMLGIGVSVLVAPLLSAFIAWQLLFELPPEVYEPFERGFHVPVLSLYEALNFVVLFGLLGAGAAIAHRSIVALGRLGAEYRRLRDADAAERAGLAAEAQTGRWPRAAALLTTAKTFSAYRPYFSAEGVVPVGPESGGGTPGEEEPRDDGAPVGPQSAWDVPTAVAVTAVMFAITLGSGALLGWLRARELSETLESLLMGASLSLAYVVTLASVWYMAKARGVTFFDAVGAKPVALGSVISLGISLALVGRVFAGVWAVTLERLGVQLPGADVDPTSLLPQTPVGIAFTLIVAVVLAPLVEEVVFRGMLLSSLRPRVGDLSAIVVSSLVFAAVHVLPFAMPPIFLLSVGLGWLYVRTDSLWTPIAAHAVFNTVGIVALYALRAWGVA